MAYINGEFEHENYEIKIEVLEPTKDENDYEEGMQIQVDWDSMRSMPMDEFRNVLKWMSEKADYIEQNFTKKGKAKTIRIKG
jgi:hypothetical protein